MADAIKWNADAIATAISRQTLARKCVVLVDRCNWTGHECDVLGVTMDLRIIDVEVKISRADFKADAKKDKWWHRQFAGYGPEQQEFNESGRLVRQWRERIYNETHREWPPKVWKHYYAMPMDIWSDDLLESAASPASGILLLRYRDGKVWVSCRRQAKPNRQADKLQPAQVMDIARLANLRMWNAYEEARRAAA